MHSLKTEAAASIASTRLCCRVPSISAATCEHISK